MLQVMLLYLNLRSLGRSQGMHHNTASRPTFSPYSASSEAQLLIQFDISDGVYPCNVHESVRTTLPSECRRHENAVGQTIASGLSRDCWLCFDLVPNRFSEMFGCVGKMVTCCNNKKGRNDSKSVPILLMERRNKLIDQKGDHDRIIKKDNLCYSCSFYHCLFNPSPPSPTTLPAAYKHD
jgi:hypothetical protein